MNGSDSGNTKLLWWLMGIVAFALSALLSIAYQNLRYDINDLQANGATRREHGELESLLTELRQTQTLRSERLSILDTIVSDIRTDIAMTRSELKDLREFVFRQYSGVPAKKPIPPSDY
jgi:protein involved in polysaccharide export with SLBB domain